MTALAGAMLFGVGGLLGIAMGSSQAAGYVAPGGRLTSWLNELAFVPIDAAPDAPVDKWSGDRGCGVQYLSQQAVGTIGVYLGYALLEYRELYDYQHVLLLGRVTTGPGGEVIRDRARDVLEVEDQGAAWTITFHDVSERAKQHGQAIAAASLPALG